MLFSIGHLLGHASFMLALPLLEGGPYSQSAFSKIEGERNRQRGGARKMLFPSPAHGIATLLVLTEQRLCCGQCVLSGGMRGRLARLYRQIPDENSADIIAFGANVCLLGTLKRRVHEMRCTCSAGRLHECFDLPVSEVIMKAICT